MEQLFCFSKNDIEFAVFFFNQEKFSFFSSWFWDQHVEIIFLLKVKFFHFIGRMIVNKLHAARPRMWKKNDDVRVTKNDGKVNADFCFMFFQTNQQILAKLSAKTWEKVKLKECECNLQSQKDCKLYVIFGEAKKLLQTLCQKSFFCERLSQKNDLKMT